MRTRRRQIRVLMSGIVLAGAMALYAPFAAETACAAEAGRIRTVGTEVPAVFLQEEAVVKGQEVLTVEARYSSNHIRFQGTQGATGYYVLRADSQDGNFARLNTEAIPAAEGQEAYSYVDESAGTNTRYWYKVETVSGEGSTFTEAAADSFSTGVEALQSHAEEGQFHKDFTNDMTFQNRIEEGTEEEVERVSALEQGTILITYQSAANTNGAKLTLLSVKNSESQTPTGDATLTNGDNQMRIVHQDMGIRWDFSDTIEKSGNNFNGTEYIYRQSANVGVWGTYGVSYGAYQEGTDNILFAWNGGSDATLAGEGFFSGFSGLDTLTIGAAKNGNDTVLPFHGKIAYVTITDEVLSRQEIVAYTAAVSQQIGSLGMTLPELMQSTLYDDNSWVFAGGEGVSGGFDQTRGVLNYVGQYEVYMRYVTAGGNENKYQRHAVNAGVPGRTLDQIVDRYEELVGRYEPRVAAYLVGIEDYSEGQEGLEAFKENLRQFIDSSRALRSGNQGFAVIQKPFAAKDADTNAKAKMYADAVTEVQQEYTGTGSEKILVVDHYTPTNTDTFKDTMLVKDGVLNAQGHHLIAKQLAEAAYGSAGNFMASAVITARTEEEQPEYYMTQVPGLTVTEEGLEVSIEGSADGGWRYIVTADDVTVSGIAPRSNFVITDLPEAETYIVKIKSSDNTAQLRTQSVSSEVGSRGQVYVPEMDEEQQALAELIKTEEPLTWLFMGDSITHGAQATKGYDNVPRLFEKYIRGELKRTEDVMVNTAVWGAQTAGTLERIYQRMEKYEPDVVSIMLGTNDAARVAPTNGGVVISVDQYEANMRAIIARIRSINPEAFVILRTPIYTWNNTNNRLTYMPQEMERLREIAEEDPKILFVEQFAWGEEYIETYTWLKTTDGRFIFSDNLHPDGNGHLIMFRHFLKGAGLWKEDSAMVDLSYTMPITEVRKDTVPELTAESGAFRLSVTDLIADSGVTDLGAVHLRAEDTVTGQSYERSVKAGEAALLLSGLPEEREYLVEVWGYRKTAAEKILFEDQRLELGMPVEMETAAAPVFSVPAGHYTSVQNVEITTETEGATIYYTLDGSEPDSESIEYTAPVTISESMTIKAIAVKEGMANSAVAEAAYEIEITEELETVIIPVFNLPGGAYEGAQSIEITTATEGAVIYYTLDGSEPDRESTEYTGPFTITETTTIKTFAVKEGMEDSMVNAVRYEIEIPAPAETKVAAPVFSKEAGTFTTSQKVAVTTTTEGAKIYYTTNGSTPTIKSTAYTGEITVDKSMLIRAIAVKEGLEDSDVVSIRYEMEKEWIFTDLEEKQGWWQYDAVKYTYEAGIMAERGTGSGEFAPSENLTRGMFATVLYRMAGEPSITYEAKFPDVDPEKYYAKAITWANKNGIVDGKPDGSFGPELNISRAEIAKMLKGYADYCGFDTTAVKDLSTFADGAAVMKSDWKKKALQWATAVNMITGKDGKLAADDPATRVECAQMIRKFGIEYLQ